MLALRRNQAVERRVGERLALFKSLLQHGAVSITRAWIAERCAGGNFGKGIIQG